MGGVDLRVVGADDGTSRSSLLALIVASSWTCRGRSASRKRIDDGPGLRPSAIRLLKIHTGGTPRWILRPRREETITTRVERKIKGEIIGNKKEMEVAEGNGEEVGGSRQDLTRAGQRIASHPAWRRKSNH
ncbi:hypothetical protein GGTG_02444 [Gaeumannomyces tritici R3-111a-1]|uniref:Uncharacterized protein n=1 Tax=Gaeumannomyces tritici (strain R3-111a-1) TaxID=644352 RepID=J3NME0_GAET3|nr:hypothetical protein GGTG_02444 [Gaeumannomyces tritici R3-111a-1]EJT82471.1 hypothetical protein GGTG_02444 [Gaeumannomyces tritici R3-111a-1]